MTTVPTSSYPLPPSCFIQWYSDENISKGLDPKPPKPVEDGSFSMFAVQINVDEPIIRTLQDQGIKCLYPKEYDHRREMKKMNISLMVNLLDLLDVLSKCLDSPKRMEKCADIEMLFIQMHHLLNEMRPHQARETIRLKLDRQKKQRLEMISKLEAQIEQVIEMVHFAINAIPDMVVPSVNLDDIMMSDPETDETIDEEDEQIDQVALLTQLDFLMCELV